VEGTTVLRERKGIWVKLVTFMMEKCIGDNDRIISTFSSAVLACPQAELLWLMFAKFMFVRDPMEAKRVLEQALDNIEDSEDIYLALGKVLDTLDDVNGGRNLFERARSACPDSGRIWMKSAQLERGIGNHEKAIALIESAVAQLSPKHCENYFKFFLIVGQIYLETGNTVQAREWSTRACDSCPAKAAVWILAADVAVAENDLSRARSILERGRIRLPSEESLWWKGYLVEELAARTGGSSAGIKVFMSRAIQACPNSGLLWSLAIDREPVSTRHPKCLDGLKRCENDPLVLDAVARFFWVEKLQIDKARKWFQSAVQFGSEYGQIWAHYLAFELSQGKENLFRINGVLESIKSIDDPNRVNQGLEWNIFRKNPENWKKYLQSLIIDFARFKFPNILHDQSALISL
jgi:pre-mRNA-processing factor 6